MNCGQELSCAKYRASECDGTYRYDTEKNMCVAGKDGHLCAVVDILTFRRREAVALEKIAEAKQ